MKVMYDAVNVDAIPADAQAVAGYVNGSYVTWPTVLERWPHAQHLSIAVNAEADAECLDVERGDATPADVGAWVKRQHARGESRPVIYASLSVMPDVLRALQAAAIPREHVRLWVAWYRDPPVAAIPAGFDACQWRTGANDESLCSDSFFPTVVYSPLFAHEGELAKAKAAQLPNSAGPAPKVKRSITVKAPPAPKRKVVAGGAGGGLGVALAAALQAFGVVHLTPAEAAAISALAGVLAGYLTPSARG